MAKGDNDDFKKLVPWLGLVGSVAGNIFQALDRDDQGIQLTVLRQEVGRLQRYLKQANNVAEGHYQALQRALSQLASTRAQSAQRQGIIAQLRAENAHALEQLEAERARINENQALRDELEAEVARLREREEELDNALRELTAGGDGDDGGADGDDGNGGDDDGGDSDGE
ncbi:MAG TPA: hypothetical protein DEA08_06390 [Planctomycetes bacterium]|nr:hypothetical protein [Planctomycetota bacterium]